MASLFSHLSRSHSCRAGLALLALCVSGIAHRGMAADWPQFMGPTRDGKAGAGERVVAQLPTSGPKVLWTHPLGSGFAGPVVAEGKVVVFHRVADQTVVEALGAKDGKALWKFTHENAYQDSFGMDDGPRGCPAIAEGKVIVHGADGMVHALNLADGRRLWSYDTVAETGSAQGFFGRACSPLIVGDKVILTPGGRTAQGPAGVIALNLADGKLAWQSVDDEAGYASPVLHGGVAFCWLRNNLVGVNPADGNVAFSMGLRSSMDASVNAAQPVSCGADLVFTSAGYGVGASLWKWTAGSGKLVQVWHKDDVLECHYSSPVFREGYLYGFHGRQEFGQRLRCIRAEDGKMMWESGRVPGGTLLLVQDTLLVLTEAGELWLVDATPEKFNRRAQGQVSRGGHRSYAAFANGIFYARDGKQLTAVDLTGE